MDDIIFTVLKVGFVALVIWTVWWISQDAEIRGKPGWIIALLSLITWPVGHLLWLVARPEKKKKGPDRFTATINCPKCGVTIIAGTSECSNCHLQSVDAP